MIERLQPTEKPEETRDPLTRYEQSMALTNSLEVPRSYTKKAGRMTAALSSVALALTVHSDTGKVTDSLTDTKRPLEEMHTIERVTGIRYAELAKDFTITIPHKAGPEGKYIVHIGQVHAHPDPTLYRGMTYTWTIESQKKLEPLLETLAKTNQLRGIYAEGVVDKDHPPKIREQLEHDERTLEEALQVELTADDLYKLHRLITTQHETTLNFLGSKIEKLKDKIAAVLPNMQFSSEREKFIIEMYRNDVLPTRRWEKLLRSGVPFDPYMSGALFKLFKERKIEEIYPAENLELNQRAFQLAKQASEAWTAYNREFLRLHKEFNSRADVKTMREELNALVSDPRVQSNVEKAEQASEISKKINAMYEEYVDGAVADLKEEADRLRLEDERATNLDREMEVLRRIDEQDEKDRANGISLGNVVVVYGNNHKFEKVAELWNSRDATIKIRRGIMKISHKR